MSNEHLGQEIVIKDFRGSIWLTLLLAFNNGVKYTIINIIGEDNYLGCLY